MEHCAGCQNLSKEVVRLSEDIEALQDDYHSKSTEFDLHRRDLAVSLTHFEHKLDNLSRELVSHMDDEMEYNRNINANMQSFRDHITTVNAFIATMNNDRKWFALIGVALIGVVVWFYTQQYLPTITGINASLLEIAKQGAKG
ncbi:MAG: hypothetical protein JHC33_09625 [Ignisphaera sp.]|nr:hypothetical protein [Ignisphaera sp.]